ncbi:class I SAM-dependent methyltransferase [Gordonia shandongensis]|uniref:class I SAM-dependent methyltransferase n=1 Tax=Gordonia shandongensis TaxID=376351 RepID=UPI00041868C8|nr:class I SAM-dependent methyltransferase [Gordonia shandongensis]
MTWFDAAGDRYAAFRPTYPPSIVDVLADSAPDTDVAIDVGCGTGQLTTLLTRRFARVVGLDPSPDQLRHAASDPAVTYRLSSAERLDVPDDTAAVVTVAQAAHWFDLSAFYREVRRISRPGGVLALITYGVVDLDADLAARFDRFYRDEIGPYWPPERRHVDDGYASLDFPLDRLDAPSATITRSWTHAEFIGYLETWSATRRARAAGAGETVDRSARELSELWGTGRRRVRWPVTTVMGRVSRW